MNDKMHGAMPGKVAPKNGGKAEATQIAELALAGHAVHKGKNGDYLVCKYGLTRRCQNFDDLQAFARLLGVSK
jgi:hypothetical protein